MSQQNKKMQLLGSAPIPKALLAMGIPTMIYTIWWMPILSGDWERVRWEQFRLCTLSDRLL